MSDKPSRELCLDRLSLVYDAQLDCFVSRGQIKYKDSDICEHIIGARYGRLVLQHDFERTNLLPFDYCPRCGTRLTATDKPA